MLLLWCSCGCQQKLPTACLLLRSVSHQPQHTVPQSLTHFAALPSPQMTATGAWPYAFLHQLSRSLADLLPVVASRLKITDTVVVCPRCNDLYIDIAEARDHAAHSVEMPCGVCKRKSGGRRLPFPVGGFVSWDLSIPDSERGSAVDAAIECARGAVAKGRNSSVALAMMKEASNVLMRYALPCVVVPPSVTHTRPFCYVQLVA